MEHATVNLLAQEFGIEFDPVTPLTISKIDKLLKRLGYDMEQYNALAHLTIILKVIDLLKEYRVKYYYKPGNGCIDWIV